MSEMGRMLGVVLGGGGEEEVGGEGVEKIGGEVGEWGMKVEVWEEMKGDRLMKWWLMWGMGWRGGYEEVGMGEVEEEGEVGERFVGLWGESGEIGEKVGMG